jgi:hypothetical protein
MAYQVNKFNGTLITTVEDGTIDTTTDLRFIGKNYAGYGEVQNENFLHLLENFANTTAPPKKVTGQIWFDTTSKRLKFYDGSIFRTAGGAEAAATAPSGLTIGDFWWDTSAKQLYSWSGTEYILVGPVSNPDLAASAVSAQVVKDNAVPPNNHGIIRFTAGGTTPKVVAIVSQTEFTLNSTLNPIPNFSVIKKGITMASTNETTGVSTDNYTYWGTASDSARLGGVLASQFLQKGGTNKDVGGGYSDPGFYVGDDNNLHNWIEGEDIIYEHTNANVNNMVFRMTVTPTTDERDVAVITKTGVAPGDNNTYDLGTALSRWKTVYGDVGNFNSLVVANGLVGNTTGVHRGSVIANVDGTVLVNADTKQIGYTGANLVGVLTGSCTGSSGSAGTALQLIGLDPLELTPSIGTASIPIRNAFGNIYANQFIGVADNADRVRINNAATDPTWNAGITTTQYRTAKTTASAYSIAARDAQGDLYAVLFQGTATAARYADLAEKYLADRNYEPGTVVMVGGDAEVTASQLGGFAIGVVSTNPAYMMNSELEGGTYIALKGRVPCKVIGPVNKGDRLSAAESGYAAVIVGAETFAVALESTDEQAATIEVLVL